MPNPESIPSVLVNGQAELVIGESDFDRFAVQALHHPSISIDKLYLTNAMLNSWQGQQAPKDDSNNPMASYDDMRYVRALVMSHLWLSAKSVEPTLLIGMSDEELGAIADSIQDKRVLKKYWFRTFGSILREAQELGFEERAFKTLEIMDELWNRNKKPLDLSTVYSKDYEGNRAFPVFRYKAEHVENGLTYGTPQEEAHAIYDHLYTEGYLKFSGISGEEGLSLTSKARLLIDQRKKQGRSADAVGVFLVQKFDPELDAFLKPVLDELKVRLEMNVGAVWADEHIERIDERIFRRIRNCQAVLLHVTNDRFNVGLEAGYALALGKPVVAFRELPPKGAKEHMKRLPFDIATLNCYDYDRTKDPEGKELTKILEARLAVALQKP